MVNRMQLFKKITLLFLILFIGTATATIWTNNPANCNATHGDYPGWSCAPLEICGYKTSSSTECYDTDSLPAPPEDLNSNTNYTVSWNGGFVIACDGGPDAGEPFCDNLSGSTKYWCDRNSTCYTTRHMNTQCESGKWAGSSDIETTCQGCRLGYQECDGTILDADGCEVQTNVSPCSVIGEAGAHNNVDSECTCVCDSGWYDCDASGAGAGDGCEVQTGTGCTTPYGTSGTYSGCDCIGDKSYFETGTNANYGTTADENFFWGTMWGTNGWMAMLKNATTDYNFSVDVNANIHIEDSNVYANCFIWSDGTKACTAPTGSASTDTTLDTNSTAETSWLGKTHYFSIIQKFFSLNVFDLNIGNDLNVGRDLNVLGDANFHLDVNIAGNLYADGTNLTGVNLTSDTNDTGRIAWLAINKVNAFLSSLVYDSDFNLSYAQINVTPLHQLIYSADFNEAYQTANASLSDFVFDADFNNAMDLRYAGINDVNVWIDNLTFGSDDFNTTYLNEGRRNRPKHLFYWNNEFRYKRI